MDGENKRKHLEFIQGVINRMAGNSFLIKGWCVTLVAALFGLADKDSNPKFIWVAFFPVVMFWMLDAYFLRQERLFRKKYDEVRVASEETTFSMDTSTVSRFVDCWQQVAFSETLVIFYGTMVVAILLVIVLVF